MSVKLTDQQRQTLRDAADYIEKHGLTKGAYFKGYREDLFFPFDRATLLREKGQTPRCCTLGALYMSSPRVDDIRILGNAVAEVVGLDDNWDIPDWNDKPSRRKADVVKALRKAAEL